MADYDFELFVIGAGTGGDITDRINLTPVPVREGAAAIAVMVGVTKAQWDSTCAVHPTLTKELVTMHEKFSPSGSVSDAQ